jgi:RNA ligase
MAPGQGEGAVRARYAGVWRKLGGDLMKGRSREVVFRAIRPTGNVLPGYAPSYALGRVLDEAS